MPERILPVLVGCRPDDRPAHRPRRRPRAARPDGGGSAPRRRGCGRRGAAPAPSTGRGRERHLPRLWRPAGLLAERLAAGRAHHLHHLGGTNAEVARDHLCDEIAAGRTELALVAAPRPGTRRARSAARAGRPAGRTARVGAALGRRAARREHARGAARHRAADRHLSMVENAFRAARRLSLEAHRRELAAFAARAAIAAENPYAWFRDAKDAATLATVTAENRMVGFPTPSS